VTGGLTFRDVLPPAKNSSVFFMLDVGKPCSENQLLKTEGSRKKDNSYYLETGVKAEVNDHSSKVPSLEKTSEGGGGRSRRIAVLAGVLESRKARGGQEKRKYLSRGGGERRTWGPRL